MSLCFCMFWWGINLLSCSFQPRASFSSFSNNEKLSVLPMVDKYRHIGNRSFWHRVICANKSWSHSQSIHAQKLIRLMQRCSLNNAWTMLLSRFNNTCWIDNVDKYCSINRCSMLTKNNSYYNVVGTTADNSWWKKLVDRCQQWLNNGCWTWTTANNGCWQQLLTGCSTTLLTGWSTTLLTGWSTTLQQVVDNIDQVVHFCACSYSVITYHHW